MPQYPVVNDALLHELILLLLMLNHLALFHCCLQSDEDIEDERN